MKKTIITLLIIIININANFKNHLLGARPLAMGGAYTAVADDIYAITWNPAGLSMLKTRNIYSDLMYSNLYMSGINEFSFLAGSKIKQYGFGVSWHQIGISGVYKESTITIGAGRTLLYNSLNVGINLKFLSVSSSLYDANSANFSFDIGVLYAFSSKFRIGFIGKDLLEPEFKMIESSQSESINREFRLSAMYQPISMGKLTLEINRQNGQSNIYIGSELTFQDIFFLRAGLNDFKPNMGIGFNTDTWYFDIGFYQSYHLGLKIRANVGYVFEY